MYIVSEYVSNNITKFIKNRGLPIKGVFLPGKILREIFCSLGPYDRWRCNATSCCICSRLEMEKADCSTMFPIYEMTCKLCSNKYIGESSRSLHDRLREHLRYATNPSAKSYKDEVMAVYHRRNHAGGPQIYLSNYSEWNRT